MKNLLIQRFTLQRSIMSLLYKNYSLVVVMYLLIRFKNTFQRNTKNTDRNGVNEQKEKRLPLPLYGKMLNPLFGKLLKTQTPPLL